MTGRRLPRAFSAAIATAIAIVSCLIGPAALAATNITVIASGSGNLDSFLSAANGTITTANDPGDISATLSKTALQGVGAGVPISIAADNTITFQDLGTLNLQTGAGLSANFQTSSGAISFGNVLNTLSTTGGSIQFVAGTNLTVSNLNTMGGDVSLTAGTAGAGNLQFGTILTNGSGNMTFQATNAGGGSITQSGTAAATGLSVSATATGNISVNSLRGSSVSLTSNGGSVSSTGGSPIQASAQLTVSSATGITVNSSAVALQATNSVSGNVSITQTASPAQALTIVGSGVSNSAAGGTISITNLGSSIVINAGVTVATNNGGITLAAAPDIQITGTVNSGAASTTLANSTAGTQIDVGTNTAGKLGLTQADLNQVTASVLRIGSATAGSLVVSAAITSSSWNTLSLINGGAITESGAGTLTMPNLRVSSTGPVILTAANNAGVVAAASTNAFSFSNGTHPLTIGTVDGSSGVSTTSNVLTLTADNLNVLQQINAGSGIVTLQPLSMTSLINLGGADAAGVFGLTDSELNQVTAGVLRVGSASANGLTVSSAITRHAGFSTLSLFAGNANATQTAALSVANLALQGSTNGSFANAGNDVDNLAANFPSANFSWADANDLVIGTVDGVSGVNAGGVIGLSAGGVLLQIAGANVNSGALELLGTGPFTLGNPGNNNPLLAANVTNAVLYTNAGTLTLASITAVGFVNATGVTSTSGSVTLTTVAGNLLVSRNVSAAGFLHRATLTAGGLDSTLTSTMSIIGNTSVTLSADRMALAGGTISTVASGSSFVQLRPTSAGRAVNIDTTAGDPLGELRLSTTAELSTITTDILRVGDSSNTGNFTIKSAVANGAGWSTLSLLAATGGIAQTAAVTVTKLQATAANSVTLTNAGNASTTLSGSAGGIFRFTNTVSLTAGTVDGVNGINDTATSADITLTVNGVGNVLTVSQPITSAGSIVVLTADDMAINAVISTTSSGTVILTPFTVARTMNLGTNLGGNLGLTDAELDRITASILQLGSALPQFAGNVSVTAAITQAGSGYSILQINTTAAVSNGGGSIAGTNLDILSGTGIGTVGTALATQVNNLDYNNSTSGVVNISNGETLTIKNIAGAGNAVNSGGTTTLHADGAIIFAVNTTSAGTLTAVTTETAGEPVNPLPDPDDDIVVNPGILVQSTGAAVVFTSADAIIFGDGANVLGFTGFTLTSGVGDNDNDCLSALPSTGTFAPAGGMGASFLATTYGNVCVWSASSDSPWLTTSSSGTGSGAVSFTVAANTLVTGRIGHINAGGQVYTVTQSGVLPTNLVATATSTASVSVTWTSTAVDHFEVWRNSGTGFVLLSSPLSASYTDSSVVANAAYLYKVRAVDSAATPSAYSNLDLATTILFTDDPLVPGTTVIKAIHLTQLRQAVTAVATLAGTGVPVFTDPSPAGVIIKLVHVIELRSALDAARSALGLPPLTYTSIVTGSPVSATAITQLRNGVK